MAEGKLVRTEVVGASSGGAPGGSPPGADLPSGAPAAALLEHERVPFVSYPYEWPFEMLREAALLELELLRAALGEDMTLKDASPYNVQWRGARPVFVDVGSFERLRAGEPWAGYRQFCKLFLYPLMLQAYRDVPYHARLGGSLEGIDPSEARALLRGRDLLRPGVLSHVVLHARLERRHGDDEDVARELRRAGFRKELIDANARRLERLVGRLRWRPGQSTWTAYGDSAPYDRADAERKDAFVREVTGARRWSLAWDLGCNDGRFARIAAEQAGYVVAMDADHPSVDALYRALRDEGRESILPLVVDLAEPSPPRGWRGRERAGLEERGRPDLVLCLALVHHLSIGRNVPLGEVLDWLAELGAALVIEFPSPEDPMVRRLLRRKRTDAHPDYRVDLFERALGERFEVRRRETLASGTRTLYHAIPARGRARTRVPERG